jgi:aldose 1-epimerase
MTIKQEQFGSLDNGSDAAIFTLKNTNGLIAKITNYGGIITELHVPDKNGKNADIVLGYDTLAEYRAASPYFGALVGRYANRIANAEFQLDGKKYSLEKNNGVNHLHGGKIGFDKVIWNAETLGEKLTLSLLSPDNDEAYPANLRTTVTYCLTNENELTIEYFAESDRPTIVNLTNHSYFNLAGHDSGDILNQVIKINSDFYTPINENLIPTGEILKLENTPFDFKQPRTIGSKIDQISGGYDHNFILNKKWHRNFELAATAYDPQSGRFMQVLTTEPGIQLYSGNFLNGSHKGKGTTYNKHAAFCMEAQLFPDSPNKPWFPSAILRPGEVYNQKTVYKFSVK